MSRNFPEHGRIHTQKAWLFTLGLLMLLVSRSAPANRQTARQSRETETLLVPPPLVFPVKGTFKMIVGFGVPVELSGRILVYVQNFQFQYGLPDNATFFTNLFENLVGSRRRRSLRFPTDQRRIAVYRVLEQQLHRSGADGGSCLKRSICEAAASPLNDQGLVGELLHLLLTPDYAGHDPLLPSDYLQAAEIGRNSDNCSSTYQACPPGYGLLDKISTILPP